MRSNDMTDQEILRQYLLGALGEKQSDDVERRLLADGELFELAEAVEGDLLAAAARGGLSAQERGRVLRRLAASPEGRASYALARGLVSIGREPVPAEVLVFQLADRPWVRAAAVAASLMFVVGGLWLGTQTLRPDEARFKIPQIPERLDPPPTVDQIARQTPAPTPPAPEERVPESRKPATQPEAAPWILHLALASIVRSAGEGIEPPELSPPDARRGEIHIALEKDEPSTSFAAILRNASTGEEIQREEKLTAREADNRKVIVLSVPAATLGPGTYEVEVRGVTPEDELLGQPMFEVVSH
jgi:hypothetical protein